MSMDERVATAIRKDAVAAETREYIVFGQVVKVAQPEEPTWTEIGRGKGKTADEARDVVIDKLPVDEQNGPFVTIAARYWQPETFEIETTTVRKRK
jgi:hypothetical protein